jgi:hypothetical protein
MPNRWGVRAGLEARRAGGPHLPPPSVAWTAEVKHWVEAALGERPETAQHGCEQIYHVVRARSVELKNAGWRVDCVITAVKLDVASCVAAVTRSGKVAHSSRIPALLDAVVRWSVGAFYVNN